MSDVRAGHAAGPGVAAEQAAPARSLATDVWHDLRRNPVFWLAGGIVLVMVLVAAVPQLFSRTDPRVATCSLADSLRPPDGEHWFGFDKQGCDVYARVIYGARPSILVGVFSTLLTACVALLVGTVAGFYGGWVDALLARAIDIVLGIPALLGSIVVARALATEDLGIWPVVVALGLLGWPGVARVVRGSVIATKHLDYVSAARVLGAGDMRVLVRHVLPNAIGPTVVVLTIMLGSFIAAEATLSFLGVGPRNIVSWGVDIAEAQRWIREGTLPLVCPAGFLTVTVLAFIMLGDAVREALDPRLR